MNPFFLSLVLAAFSAGVIFSAPDKADFYVSPRGDDSNDGSLASPFLTLDQARLAVRQLKKKQRAGEITVYLREGVYRFDRTLTFDLHDSGSKDLAITYASYPGETAVINGSKPIRNWTKLKAPKILPERVRHLSDQVWVYEHPDLKKDWYVSHLFQGDRMLPRSRQGFTYDNPYYAEPGKSRAAPKFRKLTPEEIQNQDYYSKSRSELVRKGVKGDGKGRFEVSELCAYLFYPKGAIRQWHNLEDIELFLFTRAEWLHEIRGLQSVDPENRRAFFDFPSKFSTEMRRWRMTHPEKYPYEFFVENAIDYMDEPGEWCVNSKTGTLYMLSDSRPVGVEAGYLTELIKVEGEVEGVAEGAYKPGFEDVPVQNLHFKNLSFAKGNGYRERRQNLYTHVAYDLYDSPSAMVRFRGAQNCSISGCELSHGGGSGIRLDLYAQKNVVKNNNVHHLGRAGITLIGYTPGLKDVNRNNVVYNNHVYMIGQTQLSSLGIGVIQSGRNHVTHNTVHDFPFMGIATLGHWTFKTSMALNGQLWGGEQGFERPGFSSILRQPEMKKRGGGLYDYLHSRENLIEYNEMYRGCYALGDVNPMYINTCGGKNVIRRNFAHDSISHSHIGTAFRTDGGSIDNIMEENVAYNCVGGIVVKSKGNQYTNNFIVADDPAAGQRQGLLKMIVHQPQKVFQTRTHRNVIYTTLPVRGRNVKFPTLRHWFPLISVRMQNSAGNKDEIAAVEKQQDPARMNRNIFFSTKGRPGKLPPIVGPHSAFLDPQFRDVKNYDFTIQNKTLLERYKIKQIDVSKIGLTREFPKRFRKYRLNDGSVRSVRVSHCPKYRAPHKKSFTILK
ncbi:right-handed parallel beta-helix repeat-containing protein [Verrucomicrobiaceae bacterium N1E253]|uniref:Right-handed parallel beta-helix repeat-containing protein n=1 Tax=Oceaniferula marina TaxID=2748318 RepID=A0A851GFU4_9BACT|nr:right-handed parallel beta-helix repeat-containing protein [Oceaniferula marina]NWK54145.1 right-handed parallel beta-helix repeat-containing protein [Oceaniferula marina]